MARTLFGGCVTGKRLKKYLGEYMCYRIRFDEASETITRHASGCPPADVDHIKRVIEHANKASSGVTHVIAFGKIAAQGLSMIDDDFAKIEVIHPAARNVDRVKKELIALKRRLEPRRIKL